LLSRLGRAATASVAASSAKSSNWRASSVSSSSISTCAIPSARRPISMRRSATAAGAATRFTRWSRASSCPAIIIISASTRPLAGAPPDRAAVILYPAIDLKGGACVRLVRGEMASATVFNTDPAAQARHFAEAGFSWLHVVDLDGALTGVDAAAIAGFARFAGLPVIASGGVAGLADIEALREYERDGVAGVICGRALYDGRLDARAALRLVEEGAKGASAC